MGLSFSLLRFPITVQPFFFVGAAFIGYMWTPSANQLGGMGPYLMWMAAFAFIMFWGIVLHEMGHALAFRGAGRRSYIVIHGLGGYCAPDGGPLPPLRQIWVSFAGPLVGLALGGLAILLKIFLPADIQGIGNGFVSYAINSFIYVNFIWAIFNLLPILPLDGGRMVIAFGYLVGKGKGYRGAHYFTFICSVLLLLGYLAYVAPNFRGSMFMIMMVAYFAYQNWQILQQVRTSKPLKATVNSNSDNPRYRGLTALERHDGKTAVAAGKELLKQAATEGQKAEALNIMAWGSVLQSDSKSARKHLDAMPSSHDPGPALHGAIALAEGDAPGALTRFDEALAHGGAPMLSELYLAAATQVGDYPRIARTLSDEALSDSLNVDTLAGLHKAAHLAGQFDAAASLGKVAAKRDPIGLRYINVACSLARAGLADAAVDHIEKAMEVGLPDPKVIVSDEDLATLRGNARYDGITSSLFD